MSTFTSGQRRKRVATYGKASRRAHYTLYDDDMLVSSTKEAGTVNNEGARKTVVGGGRLKSTAATTAVVQPKSSRMERDVFDMSSSDEDTSSRTAHPLRSKPAQPAPQRAMIGSRQSHRPISSSAEPEKLSDASSSSGKRKRPTTPTKQTINENGLRDGRSPAQLVPLISVPYRPVAVVEPKTASGITSSSASQASRSTSPALPLMKKKKRGNDEPTVLPAKAARKITKGRSAPETLQRMIPPADDEDWSEMLPTTASRRRPVTPKKTPTKMSDFLPSTPPYSSPESGQELNMNAATPRQNQLWSRLLQGASASRTPSNLRMKELDISGSPTPARARTFARSVSDMPRKSTRQRLIDTLTHSQPSGKRLSGSDTGEDDDSEMTDVVTSPIEDAGKPKENAKHLATQDDGVSAGSMDPASRPSQASQSQAMATVGPKITYARDRSYLDENKIDEDALLSLPLEVPNDASFGRQRRRLNPFTSTQKPAPADEPDDEDASGGMRSIHELRAAGSSRRFANDFENVLDDLRDGGPGSLSRQRSAMMELCTKLTEPDYFTKVSDLGFQHKLFNKFATMSDAILGFAAAVAIALIVNSSSSTTVLLQLYESGCLDPLAATFDTEIDVSRLAKERRNNMSKVARSSLSELRSAVQESPIWGSRKPQAVSPRITGLKSTELLVRKLRESGHMEPLLSHDVISKLVGFTHLPTGSSENLKSVDFALQELSLSILESESLVPVASYRHLTWPTDSVRTLADTLLPFLCSIDDATDNAELLAIRLFINLTNNNEKTCAIFSAPVPVRALAQSIISKFRWIAEDPDEATTDRLILALGALINLAEFSDAARVAVLADGDDRLHDLLDMFLLNSKNAAQADSVAKAQANVANGYLAVALGNICENRQARRVVRARLAASGARDGLAVLVRAVEEFIRYHQNVDGAHTVTTTAGEAGGMREEEDTDVWANHTERLQGVVRRLKMHVD